jgi:hypothetical protein
MRMPRFVVGLMIAALGPATAARAEPADTVADETSDADEVEVDDETQAEPAPAVSAAAWRVSQCNVCSDTGGRLLTTDLAVRLDEEARDSIIAGAVIFSLSYVGATVFALASATSTDRLVGVIPVAGAIVSAVHDIRAPATQLLLLSAGTQVIGGLLMAISGAEALHPERFRRFAVGGGIGAGQGVVTVSGRF